MSRWAIALVALVVGCATARPRPVFTGGIVEQLVQDESNSVIVPVRVNGHMLRFILDSGATISALTPTAARKLGIRPTGWTLVNDVKTPIAYVESVAVGQAVHRSHRIAVVNLPAAQRMNVEYDGILGLDVLARYDVVIDFAQHRLALLPIGSASRSDAAREMVRVGFRPSRHGLVLMTADVEFISIPALLDLGAQYSLVNRAACAMGGVTVGTMTRLSQVHVGKLDLGQWRMLVGDLPIFRRSGLMPGPAIVLGADLFAQRTVVLAYKERAVYLSRGP
jgi:hypothetical protein